MYQHLDIKGNVIALPAGKVVCVGRNYLDHIEELNNTVPDEALLFIKPTTALCCVTEPLVLPSGLGSCHNELEIAVLIKNRLTKAEPAEIKSAIWGYGLALDLTLRDVQDKLKAKGQPWERAKAFDLSCPVSGFVSADKISDPQQLSFSLRVNKQIRQQGNSAFMLHAIEQLILEVSNIFTLLPGDVVLTGTPKGVGPLGSGDQLTLSLLGYFSLETDVL
jgi:2-keto-4-pentenoate hydratase/2-oxohepta-3-ene-1,7-dioic acid hydratase in catechol pathway